VLNNGKTTPPGRTLYAGIWSQLALLVKVLRQTVRGRAQIVHIHTCALFSFWRDVGHALAVRMLGRKVIWHIHDGTFAAFLGEGPALKRRLIRWALRMGSAVIVLSEISRRSLAPLAAGLRWRVVPNGVAVPEQPARQTDSTVRFLFLGNLTRRKGAFDLVDAAEAAFKQGASAEFHLAGGEVEPGQRDELLRHIKGLSCRECIRLLGVLAGAAKERALAESHCVVLPSYAEGLPMAILEGMAYGRAIIATRVGAIPELITDGREGFLIEPGDVSALAERMTRLSDDAHLARRMGLAARERVERDHSLEVMVQRIAAIYSEVCQTHNATVSVEVK
jgi:glycosyltransferase involved in cell wall biosynthesis